MSTRLVQGGKIKDGVFYQYDKGSKSYVNTNQKVNADDFGKTEVGKATPYKGSNQYVQNFSNNYKPSRGIVSSSSVLNDKKKQQAASDAAYALSVDGSENPNAGMGSFSPSGFQLSNSQQQYMNMMFGQQGENMQMYQDMLDMTEMKFDTALRRTNRQYDSLLSDLEQDFTRDANIARSQAAALNPYSEAQGAMTARNFQGAIKEQYQRQEMRIRDAAQSAEEALRAGEMEAYMNIQQAMKTSNQNFQKGMMEYMMSAESSFREGQQWEQEFALDQAKFNLESANQFEGDFFDFVESFGADPAFQSEINTYFETGEVTEAIQPLIDRGIRAGMSADEALSIAQHETQVQRENRQDQQYRQDSLGVQWYNASTSRMNALTSQAQEARMSSKQAQENLGGGVEYQTELATKMINTVQTALPMITPGNTGAMSYLRGIRGTPQYQLDQSLEPLRAAVSFDGLQDMRNASKTGGALGQVAIREIELLSSLEGSLDTGLPDWQLRATVKAIGESRARFANAVRQSQGLPLIDYEGLEDDGSNGYNSPNTTPMSADSSWTSPSGKTYKF